ncbi:MAG TPA: helix-hairpin-helix domain-containing protein [Paenibacillus sp.]|nr:helix-hairpin-helix domain-containing protein [Paenibacillus sp.]
MVAQYARASLGLAVVAAFLWAAFGADAKPRPANAEWRELNEEVAAWLASREAAGESAAVAPGRASIGRTAEAGDGAGEGAGAGVDQLGDSAGAAAPTAGATSEAGGAGTGMPPSAPLDLNRATLEQLDALPGIGAAKAKAVIAYREAHGPFGRVEDVTNVAGIGPAILEKIKPFIVVSEVGGDLASTGK